MDSLLSSPIPPAILILGAIPLVALLRKALTGALKLAATLVFVPLIVLAVFRLNELGFLGF